LWQVGFCGLGWEEEEKEEIFKEGKEKERSKEKGKKQTLD
jgi:hypothetical protein